MDYKKLKTNPSNPRRINKDQFERLKKSIGSFTKMLEVRPIAYDEDGVIWGGNMRYLALQELGIEMKPEYFKELTGYTLEEKREFAIRDNIELGEWDDDILANEWSDLPLDDWGIDTKGWEKEVEEDEVPEVSDEEPISKLGEVYQLGRHRLMCGSATSKEDVEKLMNGQKADMVFTDPPYGMKKENDGVVNDNLNYDDLLDFNKKWIPITFNNLKDNGSWYCWGTDEPLMDIYSNILKPMAKENKITFRNLITWDKGNGQGQLSSEYKMYPIADEKCLFVQVGIQCLTLNADQYWEEYEPIRKYLYDERMKCGWDIPTMKTIAGHSDKSRDHWTSKSQWNLPTEDVYKKFQDWAKEHNIKAFTKQYEELRKQYEELRAYFDNTHDNMNNVWHFDKTSGEERESAGGHATPKPIALCSRAIKSSSRENEIVLDMFGGSGSTLIACEQLNRTCYMMELDEKYCDVIRKRYWKFTHDNNEEGWEDGTK